MSFSLKDWWALLHACLSGSFISNHLPYMPPSCRKTNKSLCLIVFLPAVTKQEAL